jgi:hypothetical protein
MENPDALASQLRLGLGSCQAGCEALTQLDDLPLCHALIRLLAVGQPLSHDDLVQITGLPLRDLTELPGSNGQSWLAEHPRAQVVPVATAYVLGNLLIAKRGT